MVVKVKVGAADATREVGSRRRGRLETAESGKVAHVT